MGPVQKAVVVFDSFYLLKPIVIVASDFRLATWSLPLAA